MPAFAVSVILLDIEGTVAPISFVYDVLFPYARSNLNPFLVTQWNTPAVVGACEQIAREAGWAPGTDSPEKVAEEVHRLMAGDVKSTGLKELQGLIWDEGYRAGALRSELFADVPPALRRWRDGGKTLAIYSSGSVTAQRVFFAHTITGDLTPLLSAYFDTTIGPKRSFESYRAIARQLNVAAGQILFLSDVPEELAAAEKAGMQTALVVRPGNKEVASELPFPHLTSFDGLQI